MPSTKDFVKHFIRHACETNNLPNLTDTIQFGFHDRKTRTFGEAHPHDKKIIISYILWKRATEKQREQIIVHETCHLIAWHYEKLYNVKHKHHGIIWKTAMQHAGYPANIYHDVYCDDLKRKV